MRYRKQIELSAKLFDLDPDLVEAVVEQESSGVFCVTRFEPGFWAKYLAGKEEYKDASPREVSSSYGLMQIMYTTAVELGFKDDIWDLFDPVTNLYFGCKLLYQNLDWARRTYKATQGDKEAICLQSALAAYNGGRKGNDPDNLPDRNAAYAQQVLKRLARIKGA